MSSLDHILLYILLFGIAFIWSQASPANRKKCSLIFAALYIFIVGSRTWGADYDWYHYNVEHPNDARVLEQEIGYQWLNACIRFIGLNGDGAFYIYALILMIGVLALVNSYKENWRYMCLLIIPAILLETCGHIRQGIAFGVALLSLAFLRKNKKVLALLFAFVAFNMHKIIVVLFLFYFISYLLSKKKIPIAIIILVYAIATFAPQVLDIDKFTQYFSALQVGGKYSRYIENSDLWFSSDASNDSWSQSPLALALSFLYDVAMFIVVNLCLKKQENKELRTYFYTFIIGAVFVRFFFLNELLRRTFNLLYILYFIPVGYSISYLITRKVRAQFEPGEKYTFNVCLGVIALYLILYWGRFIVVNANCNFLWS